MSYSGCAAYPTDDASAPITLDMRSGATVDWSKAMVPGAEATLVRRYPRYVPDSGCPFSQLGPRVDLQTRAAKGTRSSRRRR
jgi:hypothetical protein